MLTKENLSKVLKLVNEAEYHQLLSIRREVDKVGEAMDE